LELLNIAITAYRQSIGVSRHTTTSAKLQALVKKNLAVESTTTLGDLILWNGREVTGKTYCN
jgi:hypothetical protein